MTPTIRPYPHHPGQYLAELCASARLSYSGLALAIRVPVNRVTAIVHGNRAITPDTAFRLAAFWGNRPEDWLWRQTEWDLVTARRAGREETARREVLPRAANAA